MKDFVEFARKRSLKCCGKNIHVSLLVIKNKVISYGVNNYLSTHPVAFQYNYDFFKIHSELSAICRFPRTKNIKDATLFNYRFARKDGSLMLSRPCKNCMKLIAAFGIKKVVYSTKHGMVKL